MVRNGRYVIFCLIHVILHLQALYSLHYVPLKQTLQTVLRQKGHRLDAKVLANQHSSNQCFSKPLLNIVVNRYMLQRLRIVLTSCVLV